MPIKSGIAGTLSGHRPEHTNCDAAFSGLRGSCFLLRGRKRWRTSLSILVTLSSVFIARGEPVATNCCRAILTRQTIVLSGGVIIDSYNSLNPAQSTNGRYDAAKHQDGGDIATASDSTKAITGSSSVKVYGRAATGPKGRVVTSGDTSIGSLTWVNGGNDGVQPGWYTNDVNISMPDVQLPAIAFVTMPTTRGTVNGTAYTYVLPSGNYRAPSGFSLSGSQNMVIDGKVILYFSGSLQISGSAYVYLTPGSSLTLYLGGDVHLSGGGIVNGTGLPASCACFGLPSCARIDKSGSTEFVGTIYAPQADVTLSGGSAVFNFSGAVVAKSATMSGNSQFHYDEALRTRDSTANDAPLRITRIEKAGDGNYNVYFTTVAGRFYSLQATEDFVNWTTDPTVIPGTGSIAVSKQSEVGPYRFFRVLRLP